jgi:hypothetical protein
MPRPRGKNEYCREQAAECASAATATVLADVKEAYLNLEQGWLQLAHEFEEMPKSPITSDSGQKDQSSKSGQHAP